MVDSALRIFTVVTQIGPLSLTRMTVVAIRARRLPLVWAKAMDPTVATTVEQQMGQYLDRRDKHSGPRHQIRGSSSALLKHTTLGSIQINEMEQRPVQ